MRGLALVAAGLVLLGGGCGAPPGGGTVLAPEGDPPPLGFSVKGRLLRCRAFGSGPSVALFIGGIHGNEPASATLCRQFAEHLASHPKGSRGLRVVVAPAVNPDGLESGERANAHGVDLNRNFTTGNWGRDRRSGPKPLSEPEARFIAQLIRRYDPAIVVQVHQPLTCVDWDGPARDLAAAMAKAGRLPLKKLGARPGSLGSYAGVERQIPTVTLELPRSASGLTPEALWRRYGDALLAAVSYTAERHVVHKPPAVRVGGEFRWSWSHTSH